MSKLNSITTCDHINFDEALNTAKKLMKDETRGLKTELLGLYIITAINTGLRISDMLTVTFAQLRAGVITLKEKKTGKNRTVKVNANITEALNNLQRKNQSGFVFVSQKGSVFTVQQINRLLKKAFIKLLPDNCISSHSLRKTFGRRVYENANRSEHSLQLLSELFNHSTIKMTRIYLGLKQEEFNDVYTNL
jgi:integrase